MSDGRFAGSPDAQLVLRSREGDSTAFAGLVARYSRPAYAVALGVAGRHEDAEDAIQDAFLVALDRLEECRNPAKFGGWFLMIVRNRAKNLVRRESLRNGEPLPYDLSGKGPGPDRRLEHTELRNRLSTALRQLPELQREIVLLHDLEGWKHREISELLEIPSGTVRSHLHFARKRLRTLLEPDARSEAEEKTG